MEADLNVDTLKDKINEQYSRFKEKADQLSEKDIEIFDEMIENCLSYGFTELLVNIIILKSVCLSNLNLYEKSIEAISDAIDISEKYNNKRLLALSQNQCGIVHWNYCFYDKAISHFQQALTLFVDLDMNINTGWCFRNIGVSFLKKSDTGKACQYLYDGLQWAIDKDLKEIKGNILSWLGILEGEYSNFKKAVEYFLESNNIYIELKIYNEYAVNLNSIALIYIRNEKIDLAIKYLENAESIAKEHNCYLVLADVAHNFGLAYNKLGEKEKALKKYFESIEFRKKSIAPDKLANTFHNIGNIYTSLNQIEPALKYYNKSLKIRKNASLNKKMSESYIAIASCLLVAKHYKRSLNSGKKALDLAIEFNDSALLTEIYLYYSEYYEEIGNPRKAYEFYNLYIDEQERASSEERARSISVMEKKFEIDLIEKNVKEQTEQEKINGALAMAVTANHQTNQPLMILQGNLDLIQTLLSSGGTTVGQSAIERIQKNIDDIDTILSEFRENASVDLKNILMQKV